MFLLVKEIEAGYGEVKILRDISFEVRKGELLSLLGSNGAGKTTTLKTIAGIRPPIMFKGEIIFNGDNITTLPPHERVERGLVLVPEGRGIFPYLTVYENLKIAAYTKRARKYFKDSLEFVYNMFPILKERRNQLAGTLSGGEQQMLALARALIQRPQLLMMDEPSLGLAPKLVLQLFKTISNLRDEGYTILLVEQNAYQSLQISDRAYIIENGQIVRSGASSELLKDPEVKKAYLGM